MIAYYASSGDQFINEHEDKILGEIARHNSFSLIDSQKSAWIEQIRILKEQLASLKNFKIYFEFFIPRMGKRADVVIVIGGVVFVLEFKVGSVAFDGSAIDQVEDYALDISNFHLGSHNLSIYPILVATKALKKVHFQIELPIGQVAKPILARPEDIALIFETIISNNCPQDSKFDFLSWENSGYKPTPTIIEAARNLYSNHSVDEIVRNDAGAINLTKTQSKISEIIVTCQNTNSKAIIFVTGVPGSGKTLAGLNVATNRAYGDKTSHATFLSGNGPLVKVLTEALTRDQHQRKKGKKADHERKVRNFVQNIHFFRDWYLKDSSAPSDHIVIFDEAQRAWNEAQASKFMQRKRGMLGFQMSEPEFLISVMDRHDDWSVIVCLIGGGQEINTGEAGLSEWFRVLEKCFPEWKVFTSDKILSPEYGITKNLEAFLKEHQTVISNELHLSVSMRSFRAETLAEFVFHLLEGNSKEAKSSYQRICNHYPIFLTRNLDKMRNWLREKRRGTERSGLLASSGGLRLKPCGLNVKMELKPEIWFLNDKTDVRSSIYLEDVATEFDVQGLEIDWAGICWDADLRFEGDRWISKDFNGTKWRNINDPDRHLYLKNSYRVLLTRARQGLTIFVPAGDEKDPTRAPSFYDGIFDFLKECGIKELNYEFPNKDFLI